MSKNIVKDELLVSRHYRLLNKLLTAGRDWLTKELGTKELFAICIIAVFKMLLAAVVGIVMILNVSGFIFFLMSALLFIVVMGLFACTIVMISSALKIKMDLL